MPSKKQPIQTNTFVIKKSAFHANADGTGETRVLDVTYHADSETFEITLPTHLAEHRFEGGTQLQVRGSTAGEVVAKYEALSESYSRHRLSLAGQRLLWIGVRYEAGIFASEVFCLDAMASLGLRSVLRYNDSLHGDSIVAIGDDGQPFGDSTPIATRNPILIPDTPENRAKVQLLIDSIQAAARVLEGIGSAADPVAYIHSINDRWSVEPQQGDLLAATAVTAGEKAELLQTPADDDDEEL